jgi:signal peptidase II
MMRRSMLAPKARRFWPLLVSLVLADCATKRLAVEHLTPPYVPHDVLGNVVRLTLAYNSGAATGISLGPVSRVVLTALTLGALVVLGRLYRRTSSHDARRAAALALVCGGAVGNLLDRLRTPRGVVDFIDIGIGRYRFWTFNLADVGVTLGALGLALLLWSEERRDEWRGPRATA